MVVGYWKLLGLAETPSDWRCWLEGAFLISLRRAGAHGASLGAPAVLPLPLYHDLLFIQLGCDDK